MEEDNDRIRARLAQMGLGHIVVTQFGGFDRRAMTPAEVRYARGLCMVCAAEPRDTCGHVDGFKAPTPPMAGSGEAAA